MVKHVYFLGIEFYLFDCGIGLITIKDNLQNNIEEKQIKRVHPTKNKYCAFTSSNKTRI